MRILEVTIDRRGIMGSLIAAGAEVRYSSIGIKNLYMEYAVTTLLLLNIIIDIPETNL